MVAIESPIFVTASAQVGRAGACSEWSVRCSPLHSQGVSGASLAALAVLADYTCTMGNHKPKSRIARFKDVGWKDLTNSAPSQKQVRL